MPIQDIKTQGVHFLVSCKNNIIPGAIFTKVMYSNDIFSTQGINISFPQIRDARTFFTGNVYNMIQQISQLELNVLYKYALNYGCMNKKKQLHLTLTQLQHQILVKCLGRAEDEQLELSGNVYILLKISGVWETHDEIGVTYVLKPVCLVCK
jgi:hypothetical protein